MNAQELNELKEQVKPHLSEIGYKRWEKYLIKCLQIMPIRELRKEVERYANEVYSTEVKLNIVNQGGS